MNRLSITFYMLFCWNIAQAAISIELDPPTISLDETVRVTLTYDSGQNHGVPDLSSLMQHFNIISTERRISYTAINGQARSISQWSLVLKPKEIGVLPIPPIRIGQEQSLPSQVTVTSPAPSQTRTNTSVSRGDADDSILLAEVNEKEPFINQQVVYTVKLMNRQQLFDPQYIAPHVEDAFLIPLGESRHYQTQYKSKSYDVDEQRYAIFPQKKGNLRILPPSFNALAYNGMSPSRLSLQAKPITLNIKAKPLNETSKNWLPSSKVTISEEYDNSESSLDEGRTITRTVTIEAMGLMAQLLPSLTFSGNEYYNSYSNKPTIKNELKNGELWGTTITKVTYVLKQAGHVTLPAIEVPWYNVTTKQIERATLPQKELEIKAIASRVAPKTIKKHNLAPNFKHNLPSLPKLLNLSIYPWMIVTICLILFSLITFGFVRIRANLKKNHPLKATVQDACRRNNARDARVALLAFAKHQWPNINILNLNDIPVKDGAFKQQLDRLTSVLFNPNDKTIWNGDELWSSMRALKWRKFKHKKPRADLPSIWTRD